MQWLKQFFTRRRRYSELSQSIHEHLDERIADLMDDGMTLEEATRAARREFGNVVLIEERGRAIWQWPTFEATCADLRYAARKLRKSPSFTITCVLTLALGIGASTAVFSTINTILLHRLPYQDPDRLVLVSESLPLEGSNDVGVSAQEYLDYRSQNSSFSETAAFETADFNLTGSVNHGVSTLLVSLRRPFPCSGLRLNWAATSSPKKIAMAQTMLSFCRMLSGKANTDLQPISLGRPSISTKRHIPSSESCLRPSAFHSRRLLPLNEQTCGCRWPSRPIFSTPTIAQWSSG
jgi:hypothetical protein